MTRYEMIQNHSKLLNDEIKILISQKKPHMNISEKITPYNGDANWETDITKRWWSKDYQGDVVADNPRAAVVLPLRDKLLAMGGCEVVLPIVEEDLDNIMKYGQLWDDITRKSMKGRPCKCHSNSAELWWNNREKKDFAVILCTGYALSKDGLWRQHSWLVQAKARANVIIETTTPRVAYFGFGMTYEQAEKFEYYNS